MTGGALWSGVLWVRGIIEMVYCGVVLLRVVNNDRWSFVEQGIVGWGIIEVGSRGGAVLLWRVGYDDRWSIVVRQAGNIYLTHKFP